MRTSFGRIGCFPTQERIPLAYTKQEFKGPRMSASELSRRWDKTVLASEHFHQTKPTITDIHYRRVVRNLLRRWVPHPAGYRVLKLDLYNEATGTTHAGYFVEHGARVLGVDISFQVARQAALKCGADIRAVQGDVRELPFQDDSFDLIFSLGTLEHVQDGDQLPVLREMYRALRPGGTCLMGVNNLHSLSLTPLLFEFLEWNGWIRHEWSYEPTYRPSHLRRLFCQAGFRKIRGDGTLLFPKWLRAYDLWSASRSGLFFRTANPCKDILYVPILAAVEVLEWAGVLNYFADQTLTGGIKGR